MNKQCLFEQAVRAKATYRKDAQALTWEEKVASIERMREAFTEARRAMKQARQHSQSLNNKTKVSLHEAGGFCI